VPALQRGGLAGQTIGDWVAAQGYPREFIQGFLLPAIGTVCTCSHAQAARFPATVVVDYLARGVVRQSVHRALHGADDVQRRLLQGVADLRCGAAIAAVQRLPGAAQVQVRLDDGSAPSASTTWCWPRRRNQALRLLADASADERRAGGVSLPRRCRC
jgi:predicted NAD/FAD-binding protein